MEPISDSVYSLITNLCEKFVSDRSEIKKSRAKCFEILLGKVRSEPTNLFPDLKGLTDPTCHLITWQFKLTHDYHLQSFADEIEETAKVVEECYGEKKTDYRNVLKFLLCLRNVPTQDERNLDLATLPKIDLNSLDYNKMFTLPVSNNDYERYLENIIEGNNLKICVKNKTPDSTFLSAKLNDLFKDEGYFSPTKEENIWELASKLEYSKRRTWEDYGYPEPDKEKPFLAELGDLSSLWVENLPSLYFVKMFREGTVLRTHTKSRKLFVKDVKYLLVGMPSTSFQFNEYGEFYLTPCISIEGITPVSLELYCNDLMFCGNCFKALEKISSPNPETGKFLHNGYIFTELCKSVSRYLQFYRTATLSVSDSTPLLTLHEKTYQWRLQIVTLASICKVGPYTEIQQMPHGVSLLNYLYQKILTLTDKTILLVLYSILYPCCQVYFSRFLKQWILEGSVNDPYEEFFIKPHSKYLSTRGRTYWTRSFTLREDIVPDFLIDLIKDIKYCGKAMNLLKLCVPSSKLCIYLMGKKPPIVSCCFTPEQLTVLKQGTTNYYFEVCHDCGLKFSLEEYLTRNKSSDQLFLSLIAKKRAATLKRLELERKKRVEEANEKRQEELLLLKEQYDSALEQKQSRLLLEIERDMRLAQEAAVLESMRQELIEQEANKLIEYYSKLCEASERRKQQIEKHTECLKNVYINLSVEESETRFIDVEESKEEMEEIVDEKESKTTIQTSTSSTSYYSVDDAKSKKGSDKVASLDVINANADEVANVDISIQTDKTKYDENIRMAIENFETARRIKKKVMTEEMGMEIVNIAYRKKNVLQCPNLTAAMKNKLKVLTSEFGMEIAVPAIEKSNILTIVQTNRNKMMNTNPCFYGTDNENYTNKNVLVELDNQPPTNIVKKSKSLVLDLNKAKPELDKPIPMSVDSTPQSSINTPASLMFMSVDTNQFGSIPETAETQNTDDGFIFCDKKLEEKTEPSLLNVSTKLFSKRVTPQEASGMTTNSLKLFLNESVLVPVITQTKLIDNELLRFFVDDLGYLKHLNSLKDYFFLQDGEFARNMTESLFEKLYQANFPVELINGRTLHFLVFGALDMSMQSNEDHSSRLSFKINSLPKCFDLGDPDIFDCLSLTYKVEWPLNILLPADTISKYDEVFKFLIKLNRIQWVLQKIFMELKVLGKTTGQKEIYLMASPQYRKMHQCRHIMMHFVQTFQNYIVGEVLQSNWQMFEKNLTSATSLDDLYNEHTKYIKNILFMCLLNQKTLIIRNIIHKIFVVILKFFDYLRSRNWKCVDGAYVHPNFAKLESIFRNFNEFVLYFFKVCRKVAKSGYQPHLIDLLDMLDINEFYKNSQTK